MHVYITTNNERFSYAVAELARDSAIIHDGYQPEIVNGMNSAQVSFIFNQPNMNQDINSPPIDEGDRVRFANHLILWEHCATLNKPIIISEYDSIFIGDWDDQNFKDVLFLSTSSSLLSYAIQPQAAKVLLQRTMNDGYQDVREFIRNSTVDIAIAYPPLVQRQSI
jgi:hypothetical protein